MIKEIAIFIIMNMLSHASFGQNLVNAFTQNGKIIIQNDKGATREIVSTGNNSVLAYSRIKNIVIYSTLKHESNTRGEEGVDSHDQYSIQSYNIITNKNTTLFTTCLDGIGGTMPDYANSSIYPNDNLCGMEMAMLSSDGERLYFQTSGWTSCPAIHYFNLKDSKLVFFKAGWLQNVTKDGVEIQITGIETKNNQGRIESKGRYTQYCLFDLNGNLIKELSPKEF